MFDFLSKPKYGITKRDGVTFVQYDGDTVVRVYDERKEFDLRIIDESDNPYKGVRFHNMKTRANRAKLVAGFIAERDESIVARGVVRAELLAAGFTEIPVVMSRRCAAPVNTSVLWRYESDEEIEANRVRHEAYREARRQEIRQAALAATT